MAQHFQQSEFWAEFKSAHGWKALRVEGVSVLVRTFRAGPFKASLAYVPLGPDFKSEGIPTAAIQLAYVKQLGEFTKKVKSLLPSNTLCIRYDFPLEYESTEKRDSENKTMGSATSLAGIPLVKTDVDIQPPDSVVLDLSLSEEELLSQMKSKWRYNIRYASKHGVTVRAVRAGDSTFEADLDSFYKIYQTTAQRDGIGLHPKSYYNDLMERGSGLKTSGKEAAEKESEGGSSLEGKPTVILFLASAEGEDLAGIITLFCREEAVYLYGASSNSKRNLMPNYLVQWTAICAARQNGCKVYDFYGIPPTADEGHPMHGLYLFKTGFGGHLIHRSGCYDYPLSPLYSLWTRAERLRAFWHKKVMKKIRGR